jgi:beta-lactamase superfamily II metal-dependent hydrolase
VANLLVVPLVAITVPLGMLLAATAPISAQLATILAATLNLTTSAILWLTERLGSALVTGKPSVFVVAWLYALIALLVWFNQAWAKKAFAALALTGLCAIVWVKALTPAKMETTLLDTQQGEATYCALPSGANMLVDAGSSSNQIVETFLKSKGVRTIDFLAVTSSGTVPESAATVMLNKFRVRHLILPFCATSDRFLTPLTHLAESLGTNVLVLSQGDSISGLGAEIECLAPKPLFTAFSDNKSSSAGRPALVLRITSQGKSILLAGSLGSDQQLVWGHDPNRRDSGSCPPAVSTVQSDLMLAADKGSPRVNSDWLLDQVQPSVIVFSGRLRPDAKFAARAAQRGILLHSLRQNGALTWFTGPGGSRLVTMN